MENFILTTYGLFLSSERDEEERMDVPAPGSLKKIFKKKMLLQFN